MDNTIWGLDALQGFQKYTINKNNLGGMDLDTYVAGDNISISKEVLQNEKYSYYIDEIISLSNDEDDKIYILICDTLDLTSDPPPLLLISKKLSILYQHIREIEDSCAMLLEP
jgi:hypothetical protein